MRPDAGFVARVDARLTSLVGAERSRWAGVDPALDTLLAEAERLVSSGGKRLRPRFCLWGWTAAGGATDAAEPERIGAALELLHAGALLHDDVIDAAETRRGAPAAHRTFSAGHADSGWAGETRRFGEGAAGGAGLCYGVQNSVQLTSPTKAFVPPPRAECRPGDPKTATPRFLGVQWSLTRPDVVVG